MARTALIITFIVSFVAGTDVLSGTAAADEVKCITTLNSNARKVAGAQAKAVRACVKTADRAGSPMADLCSTADERGKIAKAEGKTVAQDVGGARDRCNGVPPSFLYSGGGTANLAAVSTTLDLSHDLFGANLDASVVTDGNSTDRRCRDKVLKQALRLFDRKLKAFVDCKGRELKAGAASNLDIESACFTPGGPGQPDPKGRLDAATAELQAAADVACVQTGADTDTLFPGNCVGQTGSPGFGQCVDRLVECRACRFMNAVDGLAIDCDLFDDGTANLSCSRSYILGPTAFNLDFAVTSCESVGPGVRLATWDTAEELADMIELCGTLPSSPSQPVVFCFTQYRVVGGAHLSILDDSPMPSDFGYWISAPTFPPNNFVLVRNDLPKLIESQAPGVPLCMLP